MPEFTEPAKVKLSISRIDVLLTETEYDFASSGLKPVVELGAVVQVVSKRNEPGGKSSTLDARIKAYEKIRESFQSIDDVRQGLDKMLSGLQAKSPAEHARERKRTAEAFRKFERDMAFTKEEAFMALPFHVVFQWQRFSSILSRVHDVAAQLYWLAEVGRFDSVRPVLEDLVIRIIELMEVELTLSKNVRSYREKRILGLSLRFMLTGRVR